MDSMLTTKRGAASYLILAVILAVGLGVGIVRFLNGMGATTNLSDAYPWGLWIVYDVFIIPLSAAAFMISLVTHIYHREEYHAMARPVVLAGFLGYVGVVAVLLVDLGRWHQFYSVLLPWRWNLHSFMFEVSMCITLYSVILVLEVAPVVLERLKWDVPLQLINAVTVVVAGIGILLSSLHQSSLGSLFLLVPYKLHALWWTPLLPVMFFTSSAFGGLSMAIFVVVVSYRAFGRRVEIRPLAGLAKMVSIMLAAYLGLKLTDLAAAGELTQLFTEGRLSVLFGVELVVGVIVPLALFTLRPSRRSVAGLSTGAACVMLGIALNRMNVALLGMGGLGLLRRRRVA